MPGFFQQRIEGRQVRVPLDEGRDRPPAGDDLPVQRPHFLPHRRSVVVHPDDMTVRVVHRVTGEVNLPDRLQRERVEPGKGIEAVVARAHEEVVQVEQESAAGAPGQLGEELGLGDLLVLEAEIGGRVLDEHAPTEMILGPGHVVGHHAERFAGHRHRQQVGEETVADPAPGKVFRDQEGLEALDEPP